jgi:hypothetical protein
MSEYNGEEVSPQEWCAAEDEDYERRTDDEIDAEYQSQQFFEEDSMPEPKIKEVHFERLFNLGNYETVRIGLTATIGTGDDVDDIVRQLDERTVKLRNGEAKARGK